MGSPKMKHKSLGQTKFVVCPRCFVSWGYPSPLTCNFFGDAWQQLALRARSLGQSGYGVK